MINWPELPKGWEFKLTRDRDRTISLTLWLKKGSFVKDIFTIPMAVSSQGEVRTLAEVTADINRFALIAAEKAARENALDQLAKDLGV